MREVDEANTEARRVRIIEAATRCLARNGVAKTSISDICKEAGMRSGHIYYYFENKDALLIAVLMHKRDAVISMVEHMLDSGDLVAQIFDVHVRAEEGRMAFGLTPEVRVELECYFRRHAGDQASDDVMPNRLDNAMRSAAETAVDAGRLSHDLDIDTFVNAVALIWQGLSYSRLTVGMDFEALRKAVEMLLKPWVVDQSPAVGGGSAPPTS